MREYTCRELTLKKGCRARRRWWWWWWVCESTRVESTCGGIGEEKSSSQEKVHYCDLPLSQPRSPALVHPIETPSNVLLFFHEWLMRGFCCLCENIKRDKRESIVFHLWLDFFCHSSRTYFFYDWRKKSRQRHQPKSQMWRRQAAAKLNRNISSSTREVFTFCEKRERINFQREQTAIIHPSLSHVEMGE